MILKIVAYKRIPLPFVMVIILTWGVVFTAARYLKRSNLKYKTELSLVLLLGMLVGFSTVIAESHQNKPEMNIRADNFITLAEAEAHFVTLAEDTRRQYLLRKNLYWKRNRFQATPFIERGGR